MYVLICASTGTPKEEADEVLSSPHGFSVGDFVRTELDPEVFMAMHEGTYGYCEAMLQVRLSSDNMCVYVPS